MQIIVNGDHKQFSDSLSISELIQQLGLANKRIAIEVNEQIVPKGDHNSRQLIDGDRIEIVHAIGGG